MDANQEDQAQRCIIGIPTKYRMVDNAPEYEPSEIFRLCARKHQLEFVLRRIGLRLDGARYAKDGNVFFSVLAIVQPNETPVDSTSVHQKLSDVLRMARNGASCEGSAPTSVQSSKVTGNQRPDGDIPSKNLAAARKAIASGPPTLSIGGEEIPWANALNPDRPKRKQRAKFTLCRIAGSERHLIDNSDQRARAEIPAEVKDTQPGENVELLGVRSEKVTLAYYDDSQADLGFDWGEEAEE